MLDQTSIKSYINDYDKLIVMCAALLHDVGHGPFSHCFEDVFGCNHEAYTIKIIKEQSEVHQVLSEVDEQLVEDICLILEKKHPHKLLVQMISSQLDADRMDYLLRDSYFSGTTYGKFDMARILRVMQVRDNRIVYKASGVQAIENYILARYHMYWQVYYHPTGRSFEQILIAAFRRIKDLYLQGYDFGDIRYLEPFLKGNVSSEEYVKLDEAVIFYYFRVFSEGKDEILKDLCKRFLNRQLFEYCNYTKENEVIEMKEFIEKKGYPARYYVLTDDTTQVPYQYYGNSDEIGEIEIIDKDEIVALPEVSEIVWAIIHSKKHKDDHKIFYPGS